MDMRFFWVRDRLKQGQFRIFREKGASNLADYFTKHHSPAHHSSYVLNTFVLSILVKYRQWPA